MRSRTVVVALVVLSLLLGACSGSKPAPRDARQWRGEVGGAQVRAVVGDVVVVFPAGVAPAGTEAKVRVRPAAGGEVPGASALSEAVEVSLDGGAQPARPISLALPVAPGATAQDLSEQLLFVSSVTDDGTQSYEMGRLDEQRGVYTVTVDHLTWFTLFSFDLGKAIRDAKSAILQALEVEYPKPDCVGRPARVGEVTYDVASSAVAYLCLAEEAGNLVVWAHPATGMPYLLTSAPVSSAEVSSTELRVGTVGMIAVAKALRLLGVGGKGAVFPGGKSRLVFQGAPAKVAVDFEQYPVMLLMTILAKTLDVLNVFPVDRLEDLQCLVDVADSSSRLSEGISPEALGAAVKSFFSCVGTVATLTPGAKVVLALLGSGPALLVSSVVGIINELAGQGRARVDLTVTMPPRPRAAIVLEEGGAVVVDGTRYGRGGPEEIAGLIRALGKPVSTNTVRCNESHQQIKREWRGLTVYSLVQPYTSELGTWPAGGVAGWRFRGAPEAWDITGPNGIAIGMSAAEVERRYAGSVFSFSNDGTRIDVFAGDTTNATFALDGSGRVREIQAGWTCGS